LGGIIMAHFGDKRGRKKMFILSILLMVIPTFALGLMPTFESIGYAAPLILLLIRILQGIAIGGELPGAWVFVCEHSDNKTLGFYMGAFTSAVIGGILLGSAVTLGINHIFTQEEIKEYAWRVPFILGGVFGIISLFLRRFLEETPVFREIEALQQTQQFPVKAVLQSFKQSVMHSFLSTWILTGCVVIIVLLSPKLLSQVFGISAIDRVLYQMVAICCLAFGNVVAGILNDRLGVKRASAVFGVGLFVFAFCFYNALRVDYSLEIVLLLYYAMALCAGLTVFTPIIMVQSFPAPIRYSGLSFAYNISYAIFGGLTPIFFGWASESGNVLMIGYYMMFLGVLAMVIGRVHKSRF
ncbi:MFS transporter, partial [uncultured Helicobacter sp.]|uniref:MFS transporter n=1 Tax=uncultured Helicobacter sp. TaxID=175537 RepID=UPI00374F846F